jgi:hypothetical protein
VAEECMQLENIHEIIPVLKKDNEVFREKPVPVSLCPPQIPY